MQILKDQVWQLRIRSRGANLLFTLLSAITAQFRPLWSEHSRHKAVEEFDVLMRQQFLEPHCDQPASRRPRHRVTHVAQ
jgi:hypothetical protein